jgi:hypothetical protein
VKPQLYTGRMCYSAVDSVLSHPLAQYLLALDVVVWDNFFKLVNALSDVSSLIYAFVFQVKGCVMDRDGNVRWVVSGTWDNKIDIAPVISTERANPDNPVYKTGPYKTAWKRKSPQ